MQTTLDFLMGLGAWNWLLLALLMFVLETLVPGVHFIWFGAAAGVVALLAFALPAVAPGAFPIGLQLIAFAVLSAAAIWWMRAYANPVNQPSDEPMLNIRASQYVGRTVTVTEAFRGGRGRVQIGDSVWAAEGPDLALGAKARVAGVNGTVLRVEAV